jgi:F420-dependent oxidoreductase-like protein
VRAPVTLGLHLPNFNFPGTPPEALLDRLAAIAGAAEDAGFSSVSVMDHLHQIPGVGPPTNWMLEGNVALAALAARTSRVSLSLLVGGVTYRNPALHAKMTTSLDVLSGGRAVHGLGAAWFEDEHRAYGFDFPPLKERFERLEDALNISRLMFTQEEATYEGRHHRVERALNNPRPIRGDIPIMVGGSGERKTLRLVAQYADGCNVGGDLDRFRHLMGVLDGHCADVGRDPSEITRTRITLVLIGATHEEAERKLELVRRSGMPEERIPSMVMVGDPDTVGEEAQRFVDAGVDGFTITLPDAHDLETVALVGETLAPVVGSPVA